jgi:hypothetical protein
MANPIQQNAGTALTWKDSGGDYALTFKGLGTLSGRQGATHDFGVAAVSYRFNWRCMVHFDTGTPPVVGEVVYIYLKTSDGTNWDNDDGEGDIAVSSVNKLKNLTLIGTIVVDEAAADVPMSASGTIEISAREIAPVIWNGTLDTLDDDASPTDSLFVLTPMDKEIQ